MLRSTNFPASCSNRLASDPAEDSVCRHVHVHECARGPTLACCERSPTGSPTVEPTTHAITPLDARAAHWTLGHWQAWQQKLRESARDPSELSPTLHNPESWADASSLSIRFTVHETGRDLDAGRSFGRHVRSLRRARGMTQEVLAERSGLSADTIRRLEHGSFSPSLDTLRKLCGGLDLMLSTLFESYELGARNEARELIDLLASRGPRELVLATRVLRALFDELDGIAAEGAAAAAAASDPNKDDDDS